MGANKLSPLIFLFCILVNANIAGAQDSLNEFLNGSPDQSFPVKLYYKAIGENAHIYNGYEYRTPDKNIIGSPYFLTDALVPANLSYDDGYYQNIPVLYDMVLDLVVINRLDQNFKISLIPEKLQSFSLQKHDFIRVTKDSLHGVDLTTGFYDRLYAGKSTTLVKRKKSIQEKIQYTTSTMSYSEENIYYVKFEGKYVEVMNKSSVLKLFKSKKSEIKSFLRKNKLNLKSEFEKTLVAISAYYDQLPS
jgi:hypothetical protein